MSHQCLWRIRLCLKSDHGKKRDPRGTDISGQTGISDLLTIGGAPLRYSDEVYCQLRCQRCRLGGDFLLILAAMVLTSVGLRFAVPSSALNASFSP